MPEDLLKGFDPSSPGLVPVLRAVRGPNGVFVRKYHVDLDKVKKMIQEAELNVIPYLTRIPGNKFLKSYLETQNIKELLQNLFAKSPRGIYVIYNRYSRADRIETYQHTRQRFFQNLYAYYLTKSKFVELTLKSYMQPSLKYMQDVHEESVSSKSERINEQVVFRKATRKKTQRNRPWKISQSPLSGDYLKPKSLSNTIANLEPSEDLGKAVTYRQKSVRKEDHPKFAGQLSRLLNYLHLNSKKAILMVSKTLLFGGLADKDYLLSNLTLLPNMLYPTKSDYWSMIISRTILNTGSLFRQSSLCDTDKRFYQYLLLQNIDADSFDSVCAVIPPPFKIPDSLDSSWDSYSVNQRMYILAARAEYGEFEKQVLQNTQDLDEFIRYLSALAPLLTSNETFEVIESRYPDILDLETILYNIKSVQTGEKEPDFLYFLIQLFGSKLFKHHYLPYDRIGDTKHGPFSPYLSLQLRNQFISRVKKELIQSISSSNSSGSNTTNIILPIPSIRPLDRQLFVRAEPLMAVFPEDSNIEGIKLSIPTDRIVYSFKDCLIVGDLIKSIQSKSSEAY